MRRPQARHMPKSLFCLIILSLTAVWLLTVSISGLSAPLSWLSHPTWGKEPLEERLTPPENVIALSLTPMYLLRFEGSRPSNDSPSEPQEAVALRLRESIEGLARHLDWKQTLLRLLLGEEGEKPAGLLGVLTDPVRGEELVLPLGDVASLAAKLDFLAGFMQYLVQSLLNSEAPLPPLEDEITLVFNLEGSDLSADLSAEVRGSGLLPFGRGSGADALLGIREITVRIRSGAIRSEADLDPADFTLRRGQLEVQFQLGPNTITSTTVFAKGEGLQKEVLVVTAQLGDLSLTGRATWADGSREFKLEATLAGLLSFSTLLTPQGLLEPTLGLELRF